MSQRDDQSFSFSSTLIHVISYVFNVYSGYMSTDLFTISCVVCAVEPLTQDGMGFRIGISSDASRR